MLTFRFSILFLLYNNLFAIDEVDAGGEVGEGGDAEADAGEGVDLGLGEVAVGGD